MGLFSGGFWTGIIIGVGAGGALIWFAKASVQKFVLGANALSAKLHAEANAISAAAKKL